MAPKIEKLIATENLQIGEGPHWDVETQSLYFIDAFGHSIHKYVPSTNKHTQANVGANVSIIIPVEGRNDQFVITLGRQIALVTWDGESEEVSSVEILYTVEENTNNVFNDGKCDPSGRLWTGTMAQMSEGRIADEQGSLYSFQNKKVSKHASKIGIANGLAFDADRKKFYYIDSLRGTLDQYDFDIKTGTISNKKSIFTLKDGTIENLQVLDGMTIDTDGNLWVAVFNLFKVIKIDPRKPETIVDSIQFPAEQQAVVDNCQNIWIADATMGAGIYGYFHKSFGRMYKRGKKPHIITSVAFGGLNLDELYVTSAKVVIAGRNAAPTEGGVIYRVTGLNAKGLPGVRVVL